MTGPLAPGGEEPERVDEPEVYRPGERLAPRPSRPPEFKFRAPLVLRAIAAALLLAAAAISFIVGVVLTVSVIGASIGVPLIGLGVLLAIAAVATLLGGGKLTIKRF